MNLKKSLIFGLLAAVATPCFAEIGWAKQEEVRLEKMLLDGLRNPGKNKNFKTLKNFYFPGFMTRAWFKLRPQDRYICRRYDSWKAFGEILNNWIQATKIKSLQNTRKEIAEKQSTQILIRVIEILREEQDKLEPTEWSNYRPHVPKIFCEHIRERCLQIAADLKHFPNSLPIPEMDNQTQN